MVQWSAPTNIKELRGFLGLINYYRRFVAGYGYIVGTFNSVIKKRCILAGLHKQAVVCIPVLSLPDFSQPSIIKTGTYVWDWGSVDLKQRIHCLF